MPLSLTQNPGLALTLPTRDQAKKVGNYYALMDRIVGVPDGLKFRPQPLGGDWVIMARKEEDSIGSNGKSQTWTTYLGYVEQGSVSAKALGQIMRLRCDLLQAHEESA